MKNIKYNGEIVEIRIAKNGKDHRLKICDKVTAKNIIEKIYNNRLDLFPYLGYITF